jgi:hypothetical protein
MHLLGVATIVAVVIAAPSALSAQATPTPQPSLRGNVLPNFPAAPSGRVAVVTSGARYQNVVSFVVRNGSSTPVDRLKVSVTARASGGKVVGRGSTTTLVPAVLRPNDVAIGSVHLSGKPPANPKYTFTVSSHRLRRRAQAPTLVVTNTALGGPIVGSVAQQLTGEVSNTGRRRVRGPVVALALCLNEASHPVLTASSNIAKRGLGTGAGTRFTIAFPELCPAYLVGARSR